MYDKEIVPSRLIFERRNVTNTKKRAYYAQSITSLWDSRDNGKYIITLPVRKKISNEYQLFQRKYLVLSKICLIFAAHFS